MIRHLLTAVVLVFLVFSYSFAATYNNFHGLPASSKSLGIGNVQGFDTGASAIFENPASIDVNVFSFGLMNTYMMENKSAYTAYSAALDIIGVIIGVGFRQSLVDDLYITDVTDFSNDFKIIDSFMVKNSQLKLAGSIPLSKSFRIGVAGSIFEHVVGDKSGRGTNLDLGLLYDVGPLKVSLFGQNVLTFLDIEWQNAKEQLPIILNGATQLRFYDIDLFLQLQQHNNRLLKSIGTRYTPSLFDGLVYLSTGSEEYSVLGKSKRRNVIGLGLNLDLSLFEKTESNMGIDFSYQKSDYVLDDNRYLVSFAINL